MMWRPMARSGASIWRYSPAVDDRLVLGLHRVRERFEVLVARLVVLVRLEERDDARRRGVHEPAGDVGALERVREDGEVAPERLGMLVGDRAAADGAEVLRRRARLREPVAEPGIGVEVGGGRARDVADLEAAEPVTDVGRVADLAHLAVAHEVDACVDLVADALPDCVAGRRGRRRPGRRPRPCPRRRPARRRPAVCGRLPTCVVRMRPSAGTARDPGSGARRRAVTPSSPARRRPTPRTRRPRPPRRGDSSKSRCPTPGSVFTSAFGRWSAQIGACWTGTILSASPQRSSVGCVTRCSHLGSLTSYIRPQRSLAADVVSR